MDLMFLRDLSIPERKQWDFSHLELLERGGFSDLEYDPSIGRKNRQELGRKAALPDPATKITARELKIL
jgi:hypothetical protein